MSENNTNNAPKKRGRPPKSNTVETNSAKQNTYTNEFNSFRSNQISDAYFGFDIFDYYSVEQFAAIIRDPMSDGNNQLLREISKILYGTNGVYTNTVDYMTSMPTLDKVIVTHGKNTQEKKKNKAIMESTLRLIKDKEIVRDALFTAMIEGTYFGYFETTSRPKTNKKFMSDYEVDSIVEINEFGINASVITLPADYTRIVGIKNSSYVIAFNLDYFNDVSGESTERKLRKFPKEIRDAYNERKNNDSANGTWVTLDNTRTIVHKIRSKRDERYGRPLVLAAINDILYGDYFTKTKRNILDEINNKIVYETFPEGKEKGSSALTKNQQQSQHDTVKGAVLNKNNRGGISFFSVAAGTKIDTIDASNTDIFDDKYESNLNDKIALGMGIASSLLNGSSSGSYSSQENNLELMTGELIQWIEQISAEINKCINANILNNSKTYVECKYLPITHVNQAKKVGYYKELYLQGNGSLSAWIASCGISPDVYFALLDQEIDDGIYEKYTPHLTSFTMSGKDMDNGAGRPITDNPTESTMQTRKNNGNAIPSPSDK